MNWNKNTWLVVATIVLVSVYAWFEHQDHVLEYKDYIFFIAFIGIHLLMHRGHGHTHGAQKNEQTQAELK